MTKLENSLPFMPTVGEILIWSNEHSIRENRGNNENLSPLRALKNSPSEECLTGEE